MVVGFVGVEYIAGLMEVEYMVIYLLVVIFGSLTESAYSLETNLTIPPALTTKSDD